MEGVNIFSTTQYEANQDISKWFYEEHDKNGTKYHKIRKSQFWTLFAFGFLLVSMFIFLSMNDFLDHMKIKDRNIYELKLAVCTILFLTVSITLIRVNDKEENESHPSQQNRSQ